MPPTVRIPFTELPTDTQKEIAEEISQTASDLIWERLLQKLQEKSIGTKRLAEAFLTDELFQKNLDKQVLEWLFKNNACLTAKDGINIQRNGLWL